jgi:hypothetical protein
VIPAACAQTELIDVFFDVNPAPQMPLMQTPLRFVHVP